jgi:hypothetical protein
MKLHPAVKKQEIEILFANIEQISEFHAKLLANMEFIAELNGNISLAFLGKVAAPKSREENG